MAAKPWEVDWYSPSNSVTQRTVTQGPKPWEVDWATPRADVGRPLLQAPRSEFSRGVSAGTDALQGSLYGLAALVGDTAGHDELAQWGLRNYERNRQEAAAAGPRIAQLDQIDDFGDFMDFASGALGQAVPSLASMAGTGGVGGLVGKAVAKRSIARLVEKGVDKKAAELAVKAALESPATRKQIMSAIKTGAASGAFIGSAGQQQGDLYGTLKEAGIEDAALPAWGFGAAMGALDVVPELALANKLTKDVVEKELSKSLLRGIAKGSAKQAGAEGATEGAQSALGTLARITAGGADWEDKDTQDLLTSMAAGAIVGSVMGAPTELVQRAKGENNDVQTNVPNAAATAAAGDDAGAARPDGAVGAQEGAVARPTEQASVPSDAAVLQQSPAAGGASPTSQVASEPAGPSVPPTLDSPSAEPAADLDAQLQDLVNAEHPRKGVYLSPANVQQYGFTTPPPGLAAIRNADGQGGILLAKPHDANAFQERLRKGEPRDKLIGEFTLAGEGKPVTDNPVVVQQKTADGAVTRETVVDGNDPDTVVDVRDQLSQPGRVVEVTTPQDALARRAAMLAQARKNFVPKETKQGELQFDFSEELDDDAPEDDQLGKTDASVPYTYIGVGNRTHGEERVISRREKLEGKSNKYVAIPYRGPDAKERVEALAARRQQLDPDATYVARLLTDKEAKEAGVAGPGWYVAVYRQPASEMGFASVAGGPRTLHQITQTFFARGKERWDRLSLRQKNPQKGDPVYGFKLRVLDSQGNPVLDIKGNPKTVNIAASEVVLLGQATDETLRGTDAMSVRDAFREGLRNLLLYTDDEGHRYVPESFDSKRPSFPRNLVLRDEFRRSDGVATTRMTLGDAHELAKTQTRATSKPATPFAGETAREAREREIYRGADDTEFTAAPETPVFDNRLIGDPIDTRGFESEADQNTRSVQTNTGRAQPIYNASTAQATPARPAVRAIMKDSTRSKAIEGMTSELRTLFGLTQDFVVTDNQGELLKAMFDEGLDDLAKQVYVQMQSNADEIASGSAKGFVVNGTGNIRFVFLNPKYSTQEKTGDQIRTLAHEMGHVFFQQYWGKTDGQTRLAITREFNAFIEKNPDYRPDEPSRLGKMEEWIADQVAAWVASDKTPRTAVEKWFKELADVFERVWKAITARVPLNGTVASFINGVVAQHENKLDPSLSSLGAANDLLRFDMDQPVEPVNSRTREALTKARAWKAKHPTVDKLLDGAGEAIMAMHNGLTASLQARIRRMNIPAFNKIIEHFHLRAGEQGGFTYNSAVANRMRNFVADYEKIVVNIDKAQFLELLRQERAIDQFPKELQEKAIQFRALMKRLYAYQREAHMPINEVQNYFPQIADVEAMLQPEAVDEIFTAIQRSGVKWNTSHGEIEITRAMVQEWVSNYTNDSYAIDFDPSKLEDTEGNMRSPFQQALRTRQLPKNVRDVIASIKNDKGQSKYYNKDLDATMHRYIREAVRRSEYNRRFGDVTWDTDENQALGENARPFNAFHQFNALMKQARDEGATADQQVLMYDAMAAFMGQYGRITSEPLRKLTRSVMFYQNLRTLLLVTFSSIPEVATLFLRTGDFGRTWSVLRASARDAFASGGNTAKLLRTYGFAVDELDALAFDEFKKAADYNSKLDRANEAWFRMVGLTKWTNFMRGLSLNVSLDFVKDHARRVAEGLDESGDSQRRLDELGLTVEDVKLWASTNEAAYGTRGVSEEDAKLGLSDYTPEQIAAAKKVTGAITRMVNEMVVNPTAAMKPLWRSDERFALIGQLGSFVYGFTNQVLGRVWHELTRDGATTAQRAQVAASIALMLPLVALGLELKELLQYKLFGKKAPTDDMAVPEYMLNLVSRAGVLGVAQLGVDAGATAYSNKSPILAFLGPTLGQVNDAFTQPVYKTLPGAIPVIGQVPGLRDPLRAALK